MYGVTCKVTVDRFPTVRGNWPIATAKRQRRGAELVKVGAQRRSRYDTGEMFRGWRVEQTGDGFIVTNDVEHTIHNEYGTVHMTAQPMLHPASDEVAAKMPDLYVGFESDLL